VRKQKEEDLPILNIERNILIIALHILLTAAIAFLFKLNVVKADVTQVNPVSFFLAVPLLFFGFQALWIILTPFALFYKYRIEFKNNIFTNKVFYLIDIKEVVFAKNGSLKITYHDGDIELIGMMGIRSTHKSILLNQLQKEIETNRN
jgi:hypothetical protein